MQLEPAIYTGTLRHRRFRPLLHEFTYSLFMAFLDIDRIEETMQRSRWSAYNRWAWASFQERDHFGDPARRLRERLHDDARAKGVPLVDGPIYLLTHLRYLGYCFNPISVYYCYGGPRPVVMAEVHSTFGESHNYWLWEGNRRAAENSLRFACPKELHVSPFMGMNLDYEFVLTAPGEQLVAHINTSDSGDTFFDATLTLERQDWTAANLTRALVRQPFMTAKVIAGIHWEAARLFARGVPVRTHPRARSTEGRVEEVVHKS